MKIAQNQWLIVVLCGAIGCPLLVTARHGCSTWMLSAGQPVTVQVSCFTRIAAYQVGKQDARCTSPPWQAASGFFGNLKDATWTDRGGEDDPENAVVPCYPCFLPITTRNLAFSQCGM